VGLMVALLQAFSIAQFFSPTSEFTIVRKDKATGVTEIVEKVGKQITVRKVTPEKKAGEGIRLGIAYQLKDGSVVYVPEAPAAAK